MTAGDTMTVDEKLAELEKILRKQQEVIDALLRERWHERGVMKGVATNLDSIRGKVEKELEPHFQDWLKRSKIEVSRKVENESG